MSHSMPEVLKSMVFVEQLSSTPEEIERILIDGEIVIGAFKSMRDYGAITNKRIIYGDKQGIMGKKVEIYTIPLNSIEMFSSENAGTLDFTAEFQLWTKVGVMKMSFPRKVDIHRISRVFAEAIL